MGNVCNIGYEMSLRQLVYQLPTNKAKYIFKYEIIDECSTTVNVPSLGHYPILLKKKKKIETGCASLGKNYRYFFSNRITE